MLIAGTIAALRKIEYPAVISLTGNVCLFVRYNSQGYYGQPSQGTTLDEQSHPGGDSLGSLTDTVVNDSLANGDESTCQDELPSKRVKVGEGALEQGALKLASGQTPPLPPPTQLLQQPPEKQQQRQGSQDAASVDSATDYVGNACYDKQELVGAGVSLEICLGT